MDDQTEPSQRELQYMTRPAAGEALEECDRVILPMGATEQHGPHLPLGTDTFLARELSIRLAERTNGVVLPAIPVGYSWVWRDIPGTVVISVDHVKGIVVDVARSMARHGVEEMVVVNGHGANDAALKYAVREMSDEIEMRMYYFTYPGLDDASQFAESEKWHGMVHACELETSWLLAARPRLCDMDEAVREYPPDEPAQKYHHSSLPMGALSDSGVFGDATRASREKGEKMMRVLVDSMVDIL